MTFSSPVPQKACTSSPSGSRCMLFAGQVMKISYPPVVQRVITTYRTDGNSRILYIPTSFVLVIGVSPVNYPDPGPRFKQKISYDVLCMKWIGQIELAR